ncbi:MULTISPECIES: ELKS/Rab6-interacting/CAST family protein [Klebsiella]|uniref:ELKS/Rab6-interacting/CAST family protein n=1 Tax=Klebsiella TaxID=570 RepID=UPI001CBC0602|nr:MULTISPECIES: ELKS/Rab6-interacting/CAST family protein [Klebsiella]MCL9966508.1 ELKS/Rab6-interacting/CAST family protein [Klebsiella pneumoniae]MDD9249238.1 DUF1640 domain-containing protein [Klebsiella variicola]MDZ3173201.1 ELKS/Rab6-interacting/CAST family protein [Klebsiella pneumoniae]
MAALKRERGMTLLNGGKGGNDFNTNLPSHSGGDDGGDDMLDKLERRIERLETDSSLVRIDLATLTERTGNLSTKTDLAEMRYELKSDNARVKGEILEAMDKRFDELDKKARWKWGSVIIPLAMSIFTAIITLVAAKIGAGM